MCIITHHQVPTFQKNNLEPHASFSNPCESVFEFVRICLKNKTHPIKLPNYILILPSYLLQKVINIPFQNIPDCSIPCFSNVPRKRVTKLIIIKMYLIEVQCTSQASCFWRNSTCAQKVNNMIKITLKYDEITCKYVRQTPIRKEYSYNFLILLSKTNVF